MGGIEVHKAEVALGLDPGQEKYFWKVEKAQYWVESEIGAGGLWHSPPGDPDMLYYTYRIGYYGRVEKVYVE